MSKQTARAIWTSINQPRKLRNARRGSLSGAGRPARGAPPNSGGRLASTPRAVSVELVVSGGARPASADLGGSGESEICSIHETRIPSNTATASASSGVSQTISRTTSVSVCSSRPITRNLMPATPGIGRVAGGHNPIFPRWTLPGASAALSAVELTRPKERLQRCHRCRTPAYRCPPR